MEKIKVNLHITEMCNYRCKYCFAHFEKSKVLSVEKWKKIIDNCCKSGLINAVNFAGGEPLLYIGLEELVDYALEKGLECSIISNGFLMNEEWIIKNAGKFHTVGISADSISADTNRLTGSRTEKGEVVTEEELLHKIKLIKHISPDTKIKINTVVNKFNCNENMGKFIKESRLPVDRWKIMKMSSFDDGCHSNRELEISDKEYFLFVKRNIAEFGLTAIADDCVLYNNREMEIVTERTLRSGYVMIDTGGYLVDNTKNASYKRVINCLESSFETGLKSLTFSEELYKARYKRGKENSNEKL